MDRTPAGRANRRRRTTAAVIAAAALVALTACASAGATDESTSAVKTVDATTGLSKASANVVKYSTLPTALTVTQPLPKAPEKGKFVVFLQCEVPQCKDGGDGFRAAAAAIGWTSQTLSWKSTDPASLIAAMQQALTLSPKPYAVSISGLPEAVWGGEVAAYKAAGVLLIPWSLGPVTLSDTVIGEVLSPEDIMAQGALLADWVIADSKGKAKILVQGVPQFPSINEEATGFRNEITAMCPDCTMSALDVTGTQVASNGVTSATVSALQRDPSIQYLASADIALSPGLPAALKAAGLTSVKIVGGAAGPVDEQDVRDGKIAAVMQNDLVYAGWMMIDVLLRHLAGLPATPSGGQMVQQILTKSNIAPADSDALVPADYPSLFAKLWQV